MARGSGRERYELTGNDMSVLLIRALRVHDELGCRLTFDSRIDERVLRRAVRHSLDVEPVLGCGLRVGPFGGCWERLPDLDSRVPFSVLETEDTDEAWRDFAGGCIDDAGPQCGVVLARGNDHDEVFVRISHVAADGRGAKNYVYLLADLYSKQDADVGYVPEPRGPRPSAVDHVVTITAEQRRAANVYVDPGRAGEYWRIPSKGSSGGGRSVRELAIGGEPLDAMREYGRERGASVNDMLVAALFRGTASVFPPPLDVPMGIAFTADLRRYLDPAASDRVANVPASLFMTVVKREGDTFDDTLSQVRANTARIGEAQWGLAAAARFDRLRPFLGLFIGMFGVMGNYGARRGILRPAVSNLGILDESRLEFAGLLPASAVMLGPVTWGTGQHLTASTYRDVLTLSMGFCEADQDPVVIERVLSAVAGELECCADSRRSGRASGA